MMYAILIMVIVMLILIILILWFDMLALKSERDIYRYQALQKDFEHPDRLTVIGYNTKTKRRRR